MTAIVPKGYRTCSSIRSVMLGGRMFTMPQAVTLYQRGPDDFAVEHGGECVTGLTYGNAAAAVGLRLFAAMARAGFIQVEG